MVEAGIECRTIFPLRFPWILSNWNYRDHCKIVTIDRKESFTGGMNVGYEYTGLKPDVGFWRDTHLQIIGEATGDLQTVFDVHWEIAVPERIKSKTNLKTKSEVTKINSIGRADHSKWSAELGSELSTLDDKKWTYPEKLGHCIKRISIRWKETLEFLPQSFGKLTLYV